MTADEKYVIHYIKKVILKIGISLNEKLYLA